jgi:hypothetical protein
MQPPKWPYHSDSFKDVKRHGCTWDFACLLVCRVDLHFLFLLEVSPAQHDGFPWSRRPIYQLPPPSSYYGLEKLDAALSVILSLRFPNLVQWFQPNLRRRYLPVQGSTSYKWTVVLRNLIISNRSVDERPFDPGLVSASLRAINVLSLKADDGLLVRVRLFPPPRTCIEPQPHMILLVTQIWVVRRSDLH